MTETPYTACSYLEGPVMAVIKAFAQDAVIGPNLLPSLPPRHSVATRRWPSLRSAPSTWRSSHIWSTSTTSPTPFPGAR